MQKDKLKINEKNNVGQIVEFEKMTLWELSVARIGNESVLTLRAETRVKPENRALLARKHRLWRRKHIGSKGGLDPGLLIAASFIILKYRSKESSDSGTWRIFTKRRSSLRYFLKTLVVLLDQVVDSLYIGHVTYMRPNELWRDLYGPPSSAYLRRRWHSTIHDPSYKIPAMVGLGPYSEKDLECNSCKIPSIFCPTIENYSF